MRTPALLTVAATASLMLAWATGAFAQEPSSARTRPVSGNVLERIENGAVIVSGSEERVRFGVKGPDGAERATLAREIDLAGTLRARLDLAEPFARFGSSVRGPDLTLDRGPSDPSGGPSRQPEAPAPSPTQRSQASAPVR